MTRTLTIQTKSGDQEAQGEMIPRSPLAIHRAWVKPSRGVKWSRKDHGWTVSHVFTGLAIFPGHMMAGKSKAEVKRIASTWWNGCQDSTQEAFRNPAGTQETITSRTNSGDIYRLRVAIRPHYIAAEPAVQLEGKAVNAHTGEVRQVSIPDSYARGVMVEDQHDECSGPCECGPLEPDGECSKGWPSKLRAVGII